MGGDLSHFEAAERWSHVADCMRNDLPCGLCAEVYHGGEVGKRHRAAVSKTLKYNVLYVRPLQAQHALGPPVS